MTVHIERCHHRTTVDRSPFRSPFGRWRARCQQCGWTRGYLDSWREAFVLALAHAETSLR